MAIRTIRCRRRRIRGDPPSALTLKVVNLLSIASYNGMYKEMFELGEPYLIYIHRYMYIIYIYMYIHMHIYI